MRRAIQEGWPQPRTMEERYPQLVGIPKPHHVWITPDGNGREAGVLAKDALSGNEGSIQELYTRVDNLHNLLLPYVATSPAVEGLYRGSLQELFEHFTQMPLQTAVEQLDKKGILPVLGHIKGAENTPDLLRDLREIKDIKFVSMWGLSSANINTRPIAEVAGLMCLLDYEVRTHADEMLRENTRFIHLGRKDRLTENLRTALIETEASTRGNTGQVFSLALDYGGEDQEERIATRIAQDAHAAALRGRQLHPTLAYRHALRDGKGFVPPADLIIRTANEDHLSNPGWIAGDGARTFVIEKPYPSTTIDDYVSALVYFGSVERRLGARPNSPLA